MNDPDEDLVNLEDVKRMIGWIEDARELLRKSEVYINGSISEEKDDVRAKEMIEIVENIREYLRNVWRK